MIKVSIIIPIYNTPNDILKECFDSVLGQNFDAYEVVIIDDGSKQECAKYLDDYAIKYKKMKIFHCQNQGVSSARNYGVSVASGKYIMFVDADDILVPYALKTAYEVAEENNADFVLGGIKRIQRNEFSEFDTYSKSEILVLDEKQKLDLKKHILDLSIPEFKNFDNGAYINRGPCARLVRKNLLENIVFRSEMPLGEDMVWNEELLKQDIKTVVVLKNWYYYFANDFSTLAAYRENIVQEIELQMKALAEFVDMQDAEFVKSYNNNCLECIEKAFKNYLFHPKCEMNFREKFQVTRDIFKKDVWKNVINESNNSLNPIKFKIKSFMYKTGFIIVVYTIKWKNR